jgi:putative ABC transport system substrate-binding protein
MRRREFMAAIGGAAAAWPTSAHAQQTTTRVVGFLRSTAFDDMASNFVAAFRQGLRETGYVEGQNVTIEFRSAEGSNDRLAVEIADLVRRPVDVIVANAAAALAAEVATTRIPIVFATAAIRLGMVSSPASAGRAATSPALAFSTRH